MDLIRTNTDNKEAFIGEYCFLGDATTNTVVFDDPAYCTTGVSNNEYRHLEDAITKGGDTKNSKLGYDETTNTHKHTTQQHYSSLHHEGLPPSIDTNYSRLPSYSEQEYSSIIHHPLPLNSSDGDSHKLSHNNTTLQQYSCLNHQTMPPTTDSDKMSHTVTTDHQQYSVLKLET